MSTDRILSAEITAADGDPDRLAAIFTELCRVHGRAEAGRRWWAAFAPTDASPT